MTRKNYELFDLAIFTLIACVVEGVNVFIFNMMKITIGGYSFSQIYTLSFACVLGMIAIYRWNFHGLIVAPMAGLASLLVRLALTQDVSVNLWLSLTLSYFGLAVCLLFFRKRDKKTLREDAGMMALYYISGYLAFELIRALTQIGSHDYWFMLFQYLAFDLLNIIFSGVVFFIALRQKNLVVDMNSYLDEMRESQKYLANQNIVSKNLSISVEELADHNEINEAALLDGGTLSNEDLKRLEENRRRIERRSTKFDREQEELKAYRREKEAKHGSR